MYFFFNCFKKMMWERVGAIFFVLCFPCIALSFLKNRFDKETHNKYIYYLCLILQAIFMSFLLGFWIHFIPCFWLACDGSGDDDITMRGIIWVCSWGLSFVMFTSCIGIKERYSYLRYVSPPEPPAKDNKTQKKSKTNV